MLKKTKTNKATYVDGYLLPIAKKNLAAYRKMATMGAQVWRKHGALDYKEAVVDDLAPQGVTTLFSKMVKLKPDETIIFAFITYKSRAHRDAVNKKVMKDPMMDGSEWKDKPMPFDMKRMAFAGFKVLVG